LAHLIPPWPVADPTRFRTCNGRPSPQQEPRTVGTQGVRPLGAANGEEREWVSGSGCGPVSVAQGKWDARGTLGVDREAPVGLTDIALTFVGRG
jgi:hypothetical protein